MASETNSPPSSTKTCLVYIGGYTHGRGKGIYLSHFDFSTGSLTTPTLATETANPSFLVVNPNSHFLYAVGENSGPSNCFVKAFSLEKGSGKLKFLNEQTSGGRGPTHLAVNSAGTCLLVANYGSGSVASLPIRADGTLGPPASVIQHQGSSVDPKRQQGPHAHGVGFDLLGGRALCADLGLDKILVYNVDPVSAALTPNDPPFGSVKPGSGVRHFVFSADGNRLYAINEMFSTITAFNYNLRKGTLTEFQTITTLPDGFTGTNTAAEVAIDPTGRFLYGSNRGTDNSITVYSIDSATGMLTFVQHQSTLGKTPRFICIDPTGNFLLAANQDSNTIVIFRIDPKTGQLTPIGQPVESPNPTSIVFVTIQ